MKVTKYILTPASFSQATKTIELDSQKVLRFQSNLQVRYMRVNNDGEVVLTFNEDPTTFQLSEDRNDLYVSLPERVYRGS